MLTRFEIENIGWTLGNDCPYRCTHCYSTIVRNRGRNLEKGDVDRIVGQLKSVKIKTVNLGGNEPIFTSGIDPAKTVLPYIIRSLHEAGIAVGLTTAGVTLTYLERMFPDTIPLLNDMDVSIDSPFAEEHNKNRGASLFNLALKALRICDEYGIDRTIVMCGMRWNLSDAHIESLISLARQHKALVRINFMKPTEPQHMALVPDAEMFYRTCRILFGMCKVIEMGEPMASAMTNGHSKGCPCGTKSFRIHSITPEGRVPVSPCVYAHDYKVRDLLRDDLVDILSSREFEAFRSRRAHPETIAECVGCEHIERCRGGCASRAYLWEKFGGNSNDRGLLIRDPYCIRNHTDADGLETRNSNKQDKLLVHRDYLCTIIVDPSL